MKEHNIHPSDIGLVLEGGGFRGMYTAGILDALLEQRVLFNYLIGVSAGAAYGISYATRQMGRNLAGNHLIKHKNYCGFRHLLENGNYFNWDFIYRQIPTFLNPLDYGALHTTSTRMVVTLTHCDTGRAHYVDINNSTPDKLFKLLSATSALPFISRMISIDNQNYLDGGIADSIPVDKALKDGNKRLVIVLTRPMEYQKDSVKFPSFIKYYYRHFPHLAMAIINRANYYNQTLKYIHHLESEGTAFVIRPPKALPISRLENDPKQLEYIFHTGKQQMNDLIPQLMKWL